MLLGNILQNHILWHRVVPRVEAVVRWGDFFLGGGGSLSHKLVDCFAKQLLLTISKLKVVLE